MRKIALGSLILAAFVQTRLEFEVASVKPGGPMDFGMSVRSTPGRIELHNNNSFQELRPVAELRPRIIRRSDAQN